MWNFNFAGCAKTAVAVLAAACMAGPGASSSEAKPTAELVNSVSVNGVSTDTLSNAASTFAGTVEITNLGYDSATDTLQFTGMLSGLVTGENGTSEVLSQLFSTSGTLIGDSSGRGRCDILNLDLGPLNLDLLGLTLDLSEVELDVSAVRGPGRLLGNLLCQLTRLLDSPYDQIDRQLNRINSIIGSPLQNIPVSGVLPDNGTFTGFLNIDSLSVDQAGNLVISGVLNGIATVNNEATTVLNQAFTTTGTLSGLNSAGKGKKCDIITLDLGPLNLDLLGLQIDLSEVMLDIGGTTGSGKLLGNLLCGVARALDTDTDAKNPEKALKKVNKLVSKLNNLLQN